MAWLQPPIEPPDDTPTRDLLAPSEPTLNWWAGRLQPLHDPAPGYDSPTLVKPASGKEVIFVACNRVGTEEGERVYL